jgi:hypothetical protein
VDDPLDPDRIKARSKLVYDLMALLRKYVVMSRPKLLVVALWIIHTHCIESAEQTPYLAITSPEKMCGKSRLLEILELLCARPWAAVLPSEAVVYRLVSATRPTMLLDEVDAIFNPRTADRYEALRALLNSGHRRGAKVPRCVGASNKVMEFSTFCAKAIAGIGTLPDTVADRSIPIRLERRTGSETVERFLRHEVKPGAERVRRRVEAWSDKNRDGLRGAHPEMPAELSDRMQEGCECLVAIADVVGCGAEARHALVDVFSAERMDDQESLCLRLLRDVKTVFDSTGTTRLSTDALITGLCRDSEAPWDSYYGRGAEGRDIAVLLRPYGIKSTTVALKDGKRAKGYKREDFHEAWQRYL